MEDVPTTDEGTDRKDIRSARSAKLRVEGHPWHLLRVDSTRSKDQFFASNN